MATITKEPIGQLHEKISVKLEKADYLPAFEKSLKEYSKKASIQGFRPGKVPAGLIKKMYGASLFADEVLKSVDKQLIDYLQEQKTEIFAQPLPLEAEIEKLDVNNPADYQFQFEIGLKPEFNLADLAKADITAYNIDITDAMIDEELERLLERYGNMEDVETVESDETVITLDFAELDAEGKEAESGIKKEIPLQLNGFSAEVQKELKGKKTGDSITVKIGSAFPEDQWKLTAPNLGLEADVTADQDKSFKLTINKTARLKKRELDEELFKQLFPDGDVNTEAEFRTKIKDQIFSHWATQSRNQIQDQIFHQLVDRTEIQFPEDFLRKWLVTQNQQQGAEAAGAKTEDQINEEMPGFLNQLKWTLISDKIVNDQKISVDPEELRAFAKAQLLSYMGGAMAIDEQPWVNDYIDRMMKDRKYIEDTYNRIQAEKVFEWAETQIKPTSKSISVEDFTKMVNEHQHHHH
ncbi:trigger factor [Niabella terrae]